MKRKVRKTSNGVRKETLRNKQIKNGAKKKKKDVEAKQKVRKG